MIAAEITYIALTSALALWVWRWARERSVGATVLALGLWLGASSLTAIIVAAPIGSRFGMLRLFAWACFAQLPLLLIALGAARWRRQRAWGLLAVCSGLLGVGIAINAFFVEPQALVVSHHRFESPRIDRPLKIALVADIQTDEVGEYEARALRIVRDAEPDLVVFAGDYVQVEEEPAKSAQRARFGALLKEVGLRPPLGAFAVRGDAERPGWERMFEGTGIEASAETRRYRREGVVVTALSHGDSFNAFGRIERPGPEADGRDALHVVVGHGPDYSLGEVDADLLLAGHTHGGQVQLPFVGPIITLSSVPRDWAHGMTRLDGGRALVVSRGIGMERGFAPRLRFLCRPEVVFIEVVPTVRASLDQSGGALEGQRAAGEALGHDSPPG